MNILKTSVALTLLPLALASTAALAAPPEQVHTYSVEFNEQGQVTATSLHAGPANADAAVIEQQLRDWQFQPLAGANRVQSYVRIISQPDASGQPQLLSVSTGPAPAALKLPEYPQSAQRFGEEGVVVLKLQLDSHGQVVARQVHATEGQVSRRMAASAMNSASSWRFAPERINGQAQAGSVLVPVCFYVSDDRQSACQWSGADDAAMSGLAMPALMPSAQLLYPVANTD